MDELLTQVTRLQTVLATASGMLAVALVAIVYLFREIRKLEAERFQQAMLEHKAQEEQNKVLRGTIEVLSQINSKIPHLQ